MCTVSWTFDAGTLHILVNRDEQQQRDDALLPRQFETNGTAYLMPVDPQGGGSWFAVNQKGFTFCLLNNYQVKFRSAGLDSRGLLIKNLASCSHWDAIDQLLQAAALERYAPFSLLVFPPQQGPLKFTWNGEQVRQTLAPDSPVSSSAMLPRFTPWLRNTWAKLTLPKAPSLHQLASFHRSRLPFGKRFAVDMQRNTSATVSTSHLEIRPTQINLRYWQGPASRSKGAPDTKLSMAYQGIAATETCTSKVELKSLLTTFNPKLASSMKDWQWRALEWLIAQKRLNRLLTELNPLPASHVFESALNRLGVTSDVFAYRWPEAGSRPVFVCNHPTGGIDGLLTIALLKKRYPDLQVLANDALLIIEQLRPLVVPVGIFNKRADTLSVLHDAFADQRPILIFAAGKTARYDSEGKLDDGPWAKRIATLARQHQRSMIPMFVQSRNSRLFYTIHRIRQRFGLKSNLEMLLLPRETLRPAVRKPSVYVDVPVQPIEFSSCADTDRKRMAWLKRRSYGLPDDFKETSSEQHHATCSR